jgi:NAD(P)-dependent dehydrogenase (short-subunit alcohol dehydrogenase family)
MMRAVNEGAPRAAGRLAGKRALITGAASGIGRATAVLFAREGAAVVLFDRDEGSGRAAASAIASETGGGAHFLAGDVTSAEDCRAAVDETLRLLGGLDILFNNAGVIRRGSLVDTSEADWDLTMSVNVKGIFLLSRCAIPVMVRQGGGVIVNTASNWGIVGGPRAAAYCASKGAVVLLTKAMALDHAKDGIRVNCVCPGDIDTPMLRSEAQQLGQPVEAMLAESASVPLGRVGRPEDVAEAVLYLASDAASFMTGAPLLIDGGFAAG